MSQVLAALRKYAAYAFVVVGVAWLGVASIAGPLVLWPVVTLVVGGVLMRIKPGKRLTWAWATSAATMGLLLAGYAAYANAALIGGPFSTIADISLAGFGVFAFVHLLLLYAGYSPAKSSR